MALSSVSMQYIKVNNAGLTINDAPFPLTERVKDEGGLREREGGKACVRKRDPNAIQAENVQQHTHALSE